MDEEIPLDHLVRMSKAMREEARALYEQAAQLQRRAEERLKRDSGSSRDEDEPAGLQDS